MTLFVHYVMLQYMDELENPQSINNHCNWVTLCDHLPAKYYHIAFPQYQHLTVVVCVECKSGARRKDVVHMLEHGGAVYFVVLIP